MSKNANNTKQYQMRSLIWLSVFSSGFSLMSIEMLGGKLLAPYFGNSIYIWGSIITVFMLSLAVGYLLGGKISANKPSRFKLGFIFLSVAVLLTPILSYGEIANYISQLVESNKYAALLTAVVIFAPSAVAFGLVSPYAIRLSVNSTEKSGHVAGILYFLSTLGSALGTLVTSFYWVQYADVYAIILCHIVLLMLLGFILILNDRAIYQTKYAIQKIAIASLFGFGLLGTALAVLDNRSTQDSSIIFQQNSLYQTVSVIENKARRCLKFRLSANQQVGYQSCINLDEPKKQVFSYSKQIIAASTLHSNPKNILIIGLGGGVVATAFSELYPTASITSVELDGTVVQVARDYFNYKDDTEQMTTVVSDGRVFVKEAIKQKQTYDLIVLDAFNTDYIPEHLMTREFFRELQQVMNGQSVVIANTFVQSQVRLQEIATYQSVFESLYGVNFPESGNRILIASDGDPFNHDSNHDMSDTLKPYNINLQRFFDHLKKIPFSEAEAFTDVFSPVNSTMELKL